MFLKLEDIFDAHFLHCADVPVCFCSLDKEEGMAAGEKRTDSGNRIIQFFNTRCRLHFTASTKLKDFSVQQPSAAVINLIVQNFFSYLVALLLKVL